MHIALVAGLALYGLSCNLVQDMLVLKSSGGHATAHELLPTCMLEYVAAFAMKRLHCCRPCAVATIMAGSISSSGTNVSCTVKLQTYQTLCESEQEQCIQQLMSFKP